jgi:SH3-like domain-containing protein
VRTRAIRLGTRAAGATEAARLGAAVRIALVALATSLAWTSGAVSAEGPRRTPSGLPVPRYVSLKFGEVNARAGPGDDYKLLWTYRARGLPLQVIAETADWRRVCDPEGAAAWVHQRTVDTRRTVMRVNPAPMPMHRRPDARSQTVALLSGRALASLDSCRGGWCQVEVGRTKGWAPAGELWGTDERPQCRPQLPSRR